jgi:cytochrome c
MSDLGFNKIAFCLLGTGLALIGLNEASHAFFPHTEHVKEGYKIDVPGSRDSDRHRGRRRPAAISLIRLRRKPANGSR